MRLQVFLAATILALVSFTERMESFSGKIVYVNTFSDLKGNDITDRMVSYFGKQNNYFINDSNYKAYDENNELLYLYNSSTNVYYSCDAKENTAEKIDAGTITARKIRVRSLQDKETICGYECSSVEKKTESGTTVYYFTPLIRIDKKNYSKHNYGEWNACLDATNGALPLKIIYTDRKVGYIWTAVAKEVTNITLAQKDFAFPAEVKLKN